MEKSMRFAIVTALVLAALTFSACELFPDFLGGEGEGEGEGE
jgi:hypothetical protein